MKMRELLTIGSVTIWISEDESYIKFTANLDICNDGTGPSHGDKSYQPRTTYNPYLNADKDFYIVYPPQIRTMIKPVFLGCKGKVTNTATGAHHVGVWGECGPKNKTGECAYILAKHLNPKISYNSGDSSKHYLYEAWPGVPARVGDKTYKLIPAGK